MASAKDFDDAGLLAMWLNGDESAAEEFHRRYADKVLSLVQRNLARRLSARFDPEDVVQSVLRTIFRQAKSVGVPSKDTAELWRFMSTVALNKVRNRIKHERAQKRDISRTVSDPETMARLFEPNEQDGVELADFLEQLANALEPTQGRVLQMLLEGQSEEEIAVASNLTTRTIRRYKQVIFDTLRQLDAG